MSLLKRMGYTLDLKHDRILKTYDLVINNLEVSSIK